MKEQHISGVGWFLLWANLAILAFFTFILSARLQQSHTVVGDAFDLAVKDAMFAEPDDVATNLLALDPATPGLFWHSDANDNLWILVATWKNTENVDFDAFVGKFCIMNKFVWVTAVPQVKDKCSSFEERGNDLDLRLRQYLGMRPDDSNDTVIEFWVKKEDLFRPCPDPEVEDCECELGIPNKSENSTRQKDARWFKHNLLWYFGDTPYPWTRLGYTYDWGDSENKVGASEFVIRKGSIVMVSSTTETEKYCTQEYQPERAPMTPLPSSIPVFGATTVNNP